MSTGGSIESVTLDGRTFSVAADAESQRKLGGFENELQANGDGTVREIKTRVAWSLDGITVDTDDAQGDAEFLQELQDRNGFYPVSITYASGVVYQGTGKIIGETPTSSQNATSAIALMGLGKLTRQ